MTTKTMIRARMQTGLQAFLQGGPVGLYYAAKLAAQKRRMALLQVYLCRERELHREHLRTLNHELTQLVMENQATSQAAGQFWKACGQAEVQS
jgi:hypothetical protein